MKFIAVSVTTSLLALGCAADPGTRPHDMSAASHERAAQSEDQAASAHQEQYNPSAESTAQRCSGKGGCWTSTSNPTHEHEADAQHHRELAAKHRAASAALKQAEAQACAGISDDDRDTSPFYHREDVRSATPFEEVVKAGKATTTKRVGATVSFRAVPGMTTEWLQRVVDCHLARAAAAGHEMPEMDYCPLVLKNVTAKVGSVGDGFAVNIRSEDPATADLILKRAEALVPARNVAP